MSHDLREATDWQTHTAREGATMTSLPPGVQELAERVAASHGIDVLEARLAGGGSRQLLSVVIDADGPVEAGVVEQVSRELSRALDDADPIEGRYVLEVTTPGLDRPLRTPRDFRRQLGHEVSVTVATAGGPQRLQGVVRAVGDDRLTLEVDGAHVDVALADVSAGKVVLPW
jgi:ribosome maturation factor RimP